MLQKISKILDIKIRVLCMNIFVYQIRSAAYFRYVCHAANISVKIFTGYYCTGKNITLAHLAPRSPPGSPKVLTMLFLTKARQSTVKLWCAYPLSTTYSATLLCVWCRIASSKSEPTGHLLQWFSLCDWRVNSQSSFLPIEITHIFKKSSKQTK